MIPLHKFLYDLFGYRIFDNKEIDPFMKKVTRMGKLDEPKKAAILTELLKRMAALEDKEEMRVQEVRLPPMPRPVENTPSMKIPEINFLDVEPLPTHPDYETMKWLDLRAYARGKGMIIIPTDTKDTIIAWLTK